MPCSPVNALWRTFTLSENFIAGLNAACYSTKKEKNESLVEAAFDFSRWQWDYVNSGFTMTFNITPSLSIGVGIRGVASISVKGEITLSLFFGVMSSQAEGSLTETALAGQSDGSADAGFQAGALAASPASAAAGWCKFETCMRRLSSRQ